MQKYQYKKMSPLERRATAGLAGIYGLRMLGLFLILPVFALYAEALPGSPSHTLIGVALGAYGVTQAILQIPFGWASDRFGRKPVIYFGLLLFAFGSFLAAATHNIHVIILGRALQGAGAISAAVMAMAADLTSDQNRAKAMALIGASIGVTFALSLVLGPWLYASIGIPGIFALTGVLALCAMAVVRVLIPTPPVSSFHDDAEPQAEKFVDILRDSQLMRLNYGAFALHAVLMALFVVLPFALRNAGLDGNHHWQVYLPVVALSFVVMLPAMLYADRARKTKAVFALGVATLLAGAVLLAEFDDSLLNISFGLLVFFAAFNLLEALLPSLVTRTAPPGAKGTAIGVYSSIQFFGAFFGAAVGGWLSEGYGSEGVFLFCALLILLWGILALTMRAPEGRQTALQNG
jgi:MFS family permease